MQTLESTRSRISEKIIVETGEDYDRMEAGDFTRAGFYSNKLSWMVYEGPIDGKEAFMMQNPDNLSEIVSYRGRKDSILIITDGLWIPPVARETKIYKTGDNGFGHKMGLLMTAGLWKNLADLNLRGGE